MKLLHSLFCLSFVASASLLSLAEAQTPNSESQSIVGSAPLLIPSDPFLISVSLRQDGSLAVDPAGFLEPGALPFSQMELPPRVRTTLEGNSLVGEFALQDGTWSPLFTVPSLPETSLATDGANLLPSVSGKGGATDGASQALPAADATAVILDSSDPLALGASDPAFPKDVAATWLQAIRDRKSARGHRQFFVNNVSGDDTAEGAMLHPQLGNAKVRGPLRTFNTALRKMKSGDEIVIVGTGTPYDWDSLARQKNADLIITPIGNVIFNSQ